MKSFLRLVMAFMLLVGVMSPQPVIAADSLADIESAVHVFHGTGDIMDDDVYYTLLDLLVDANLAPDASAEGALRVSIADVCKAFKGFGISTAASNAIINMVVDP